MSGYFINFFRSLANGGVPSKATTKNGYTAPLDMFIREKQLPWYKRGGFVVDTSKPNKDYGGVSSGYDAIKDAETQAKYQKIMDYALSYPGTRYTPEILDLLARYLDPDTMAKAVAASIAETGAGKAASSFKGDGKLKNTNWFGIHISKNGQPANQYDPESWEIMAQDLLRNFGPGSRFSELTPEKIYTYTGGDNPDTWTKNFYSVLRAMGY